MKRRDFLRLSSASTIMSNAETASALSHTAEAKFILRWLGGATMEITIGSLRFLTDPCLGEGAQAFVMADPNEAFDPARGSRVRPHARLVDFPGLSMQSFDAIILSHAHEDHFNQSARSRLGHRFSVICPVHDGNALSELGIATEPLAHGARRVFERDGVVVEITAIPAVHSMDADVAQLIGAGNGYYLSAVLPNRTMNAYWTGDSFMTAPVMDAVSRLPKPDLFIPHIGAVGRSGTFGQLSMDGQQATAAAQAVDARVVVPIHHSTFSLYAEPVGAMIAAHQADRAAGQLTILREGDTIEL